MEVRVLSREVEDRLTHGRREHAPVLDRLGLEEALHPSRIEPADLAIDRASRDTRLLRSLDGCRAKDDDGANQLIALLLRPVTLKLELVPVISGRELRSFVAGHPRILPIPGATILTRGSSG